MKEELTDTDRHTGQEKSAWPWSSVPGRAALSHSPTYKTHQRCPGETKTQNIPVSRHLFITYPHYSTITTDSHAVCGVISMRNLEHGGVVVFRFSQFAASATETQEEQQATRAAGHDQEQQTHGDPQLRAGRRRGDRRRASFWTHTSICT